MIEIIPNWHPVFVHFAIGLLSISALFHVVAAVNGKSTNYYQFEIVANWNLWLGALLAIATVIAGWFAYNSVDHDTPSHLAMTDHRNWALVTTGLFVVLAIWSFQRARKTVPIGWAFTMLMLIATGLLGATGWKGGELVYRHGLGVMSLPSKSDHDHASHDHGGAAQHDEHSHDNISESDHEVGEIDHGHDSNEHSHDGLDAADGAADTQSDTKSVEKPVQETKKADEGHTHEHDHGDHTH